MQKMTRLLNCVITSALLFALGSARAEDLPTSPLQEVALEAGSYLLVVKHSADFEAHAARAEELRTISRISNSNVVHDFFKFLKESPVAKPRIFGEAPHTQSIVVLHSNGIPLIGVHYYNFTLPNAARLFRVKIENRKMKSAGYLLGGSFLVHSNEWFDFEKLQTAAIPLRGLSRNRDLIPPKLR